VILLWLGREDVKKEDREAFIMALGTFEDGCGKIYQYRAYFLAAAGLAEFRQSNFAYEIVDWLVNLGFGYFNVEKQEWDIFHSPSAEAARVALLETERSLAVTALIELINNTTIDLSRRLAAWALGQIGIGYPEAIYTLISCIYTITPNATCYRCDGTHYQAIESLGQVGRGHPQAISVLLNLICGLTDYSTIIGAAKSLGKISPSHKPKSIKVLTDLMRSSYRDNIRCRAAYGLAQIASNYLEEAINTLSNLIYSPDEFVRRDSARYLREIAPNHPEAVAAHHLVEITSDYPESIKKLIDLIFNNPGTPTRYLATERLVKILVSHQLESVVSTLKDCLSDQVGKNDYSLYYNCYKVIWHCAQNMTYPAFYQAWHPQEEVRDTTTPDSQSLNQADLPQSLQSAIANDPQLNQIIHLICIDGSQFIEPDRPAAEIYDQMLDQNCPECDQYPKRCQHSSCIGTLSSAKVISAWFWCFTHRPLTPHQMRARQCRAPTARHFSQF
jgi:HEAT repeat protein